jgi:hypothetical protein
MIWISLSRWWMYTAQIFSRNYRMMEMKNKGAEFSSTKKSTRKRKMDGSLLTVKRDHTSEWKRREETPQGRPERRKKMTVLEHIQNILRVFVPRRTTPKKTCGTPHETCGSHMLLQCKFLPQLRRRILPSHLRRRHRRTWLGVAVSQTPQ